MATLRIYGQESGPGILEDLILKGKERGNILIFSDAGNLVREMQSFANHRVIENKNGSISRLLVEALIEKECNDSGKPDNLVAFVKLIYQSHKAIDEFWKLYEKKEEQMFLQMLKFIKEISKNAEDEKKSVLEYEEEEKEKSIERYWAKSVAHHTLDWYIQSDPGGFNRINDSRKVASHILIMIKDYNAEISDGGVFLSYDKKDLSKFGGWKGYESLYYRDI